MSLDDQRGAPAPARAPRSPVHTPRSGRPGPRDQEERWILEAVEGEEGPRSPRALGPSTRAALGEESPVPLEVAHELARAVGRGRSAELEHRLARAIGAYRRDRYAEAYRTTRPLAEAVPESAAVRELHGLVCYRSGRWREAARNLEASRALSGGDPDQLPVIMDCRRALGQHRKVLALWKELRSSSPAADVLAEGRLVLAGDLADAGDLDAAVDLLVSAGAGRNLRHPAPRHVRQWYVLGDLYERAGDVARARELFARVSAADPELADAGHRLAELGRRRRP